MTAPIKDDRDMDTAVHSWLHDDDEPTLDRNRQIGRVMGRVDETKQRRRLWPLNPFGRRAVHSAVGTPGAKVVARDETGALAPLRVMTVVALLLVVATVGVWIAARAPATPPLPAAWTVDAADQAVFERLVTLWAGEETDLATTQETYAEDAVHNVLWLDDEETVRGDVGIWSRMLRSQAVDWTDQQLIRIDRDSWRDRRYLLLSATLGDTACVVWVGEDRITRHDCVLPMSIEDVAPPILEAPSAATIAAREALSASFTAALRRPGPGFLEDIVAPHITHHVLSRNQSYTVAGIADYGSVMSAGGTTVLAEADLPAAEGQLRWTNYSTVAGGSLCVFEAQDGLITRHDCVASGSTTVPLSLMAPTDA